MSRAQKGWTVFSIAALGWIFAITAEAVNISVNIPGTYTTSNNPGAVVANFYSFALLIGGILAFGAIVWGGVKYAIAAGNPSAQSDGKDWIVGAGKAKINVSKHLDVDISGAGTILYKGSPTVSQEISGAGSVKKVD